MIAVVLLVYIDTAVLNNTLEENSITEHGHNAVLFFAFLVFAVCAKRIPQSRGYLTLVATLFCMMLIRENDMLLDQIVHGFWKYPASIVFLLGVTLAFRSKATTLRPMLAHFEDRSFSYLLVGFLLVVVYSRLQGSGHFWEPALGPQYNPALKSIMQESTEFLGYAILLFGAVLSYLRRFGSG